MRWWRAEGRGVMRQEELAGRWRELADEVWLGVAEWRAAHPKATFAEIERVVDERIGRIRTRVLADVAMASATSDMGELAKEERPHCQECGGELEPRGQQTRELMTLRGDDVELRRSYAVCRSCGGGVFPPR